MKQCLWLWPHVFILHGNRGDVFCLFFLTVSDVRKELIRFLCGVVKRSGGPTGRSRTSNIQIRRDVAAKWSVFSDSRCAAVPSTVITARSITPCQREKCINTGYCRTPCLTHEWENYPVPSCCSTFILGGKQLLTRNHFSNHFEAVFLDVRVTQKWRQDDAGEHLAFILQLCFKKKKFNLTVRSMYEYVLWWQEDELRHLQCVSKPDVCWWALWSLVTFVMAVTRYYKPK